MGQPFNTRPAHLVLDGAGGRYDIALAGDPRTWESFATTTVNETVTVPAGVPAGSYRLALWLPDASPGLRGDARFAARLANDGVWDAGAGLNVLAERITVTAG